MESIWEKTCKGPARPPLYGNSAGGRGRDRRRDDGHSDRAGAAGARPAGRSSLEAGHVGGGHDGPHDGEAHEPSMEPFTPELIERLRPGKGGRCTRGPTGAPWSAAAARIELEHIDCDLERNGRRGSTPHDREDALLPRGRGGARRSGWTRRSRAGHPSAAARHAARVRLARAGAVPSAEVPARRWPTG